MKADINLRHDPSLTEDQQRAANEIADFLENTRENVLVFTGSAGTGKTHLMKTVIQHLAAAKRQFRLMAPTGRAANVLSRRTQHIARTIHATIYQFDDIKEDKMSEDDGEHRLYFAAKSNGDDRDAVYLVDEASMVGNLESKQEFVQFGSGRLLNDLMKYCDFARYNQRKIIFVGDAAQLPPVSMNHSPALNEAYVMEHYGVKVAKAQLTQVIRQQADSLILANAARIRQGIETGEYSTFKIKTDEKDVRQISVASFMKAYTREGLEEGIDTSMVVTYTNARARQFNFVLRRCRYSEAGMAVPQVGDRLILHRNTRRNGWVYFNGEFATIEAVSPETVCKRLRLKKGEQETEVTLRFREVALLFEDLPPAHKRVTGLLLEDLLNNNDAHLSPEQTRALFVDFMMRHADLRNKPQELAMAMMADPWLNAFQMKYGYAVTCHKAQGGEWPQVYVDFAQVPSIANELGFRWAYTAFTRGKERLVAIDPPCITAESSFVKAMEKSIENNNTGGGSPALSQAEDTQTAVQAGELHQVVAKLVKDHGHRIQRVEHLQYCERYMLDNLGTQTSHQDGEGSNEPVEGLWEVNCFYNKSQKVSSVTVKSLGNASMCQELHQELKNLKGTPLVKQPEIDAANLAVKASSACRHGAQIALQLHRLAEVGNMAISELAFHQYQVKCTLVRKNQWLQLILYYNQQGHVTRIMHTAHPAFDLAGILPLLKELETP